MQRRTLLSLLAAGSAAALLADTTGPPKAQAASRSRQPVLLLLELQGGNDGLNTLAPLHDPLYRQARPRLALSPADAVPLAGGLALHPALAPLLPLWRQRRLTLALGVGWPRPNRSHFQAADQWATADPSGEGPGWLAAALDQRQHPGPLLALGPTGCPALEGGRALALQLDPAQLAAAAPAQLDPERAGSHAVLRQLLALELEGQRHLQRLREALPPLPPGFELPRGSLGQQVGLALQLIAGGQCPPVLQLAQGGYDTHADQAARHQRLLAELAAALTALATGLDLLPDRPPVTLLTVSEFGRRLQENGSGGTDHGAASVAFVVGDGVPELLTGDGSPRRPGVIGTYPSLRQLDARGDLIAGLTPPELYRRVLAAALG
jgi:uncharacterized protein (DUF1501 family)